MAEFFGFTTPIFVAAESVAAFYHFERQHIVLGDRFIFSMANVAPGLARLAGVIAHEQSHRFQVTNELNKFLLRDENTVKFVELHADYMAGCYVCWRARERNIPKNELSKLFYDLGDTEFRNVDHHGTHKERVFSFIRGITEFADVLRSKPSAGAREAAFSGLKHVGREQRSLDKP